MQLTEKHLEYWRKNLQITAILLSIWFVVTFVLGYFACELSFNFFGWPFSFYMAAQGSLIIYVVDHLVLRALHEQARPRVRRARRGGRIMAVIQQASGRRSLSATDKGSSRSCKKYYTFYTGGFIALRDRCSRSPSRWACRGSGSATSSCSPPSCCTPASAS